MMDITRRIKYGKSNMEAVHDWKPAARQMFAQRKYSEPRKKQFYRNVNIEGTRYNQTMGAGKRTVELNLGEDSWTNSHKKKYTDKNLTQNMNSILSYENGPNYRKDNLVSPPNHQRISVGGKSRPNSGLINNQFATTQNVQVKFE